MQLALTEQLFDAALGEFAVVDRGQPSLPTKIPFLLKGISVLLEWSQPLLVLGMLLEVIDGFHGWVPSYCSCSLELFC